MPLYLKQSTQVSVPVGPLFDSTDFISEEAAVAYNAAGIDVDVIKSGTTKADVTLANSAGDGYWRHVSNGNYALTLSTTDTNTLGSLRVTFKATGVLDWWQDFEIVPANVYDSIVAGSDYLQADAVQVEGVDATNQIRDSVVDDSTRIDASALNTLSSHDPGTTIGTSTYAGGAVASVTGNVGGNVAGSVGSVTGAVGSVTGAVGSVTSAVTVGTNNDKTGYGLADGALTAAVIATDAIDGDAIAATAVSEIQSGLATAAGVTAVEGKVDTVDTVVDAIKLKTDTIPASPAAVGSEMTLTAAYDAAKNAAAAGAQMDLVNAPNATAVTAIQNGLAATGEAATAVGTLNDFDPATDVVARVTLVDTTTTNTDMRGTDGAELTGAATAALAAYDPPTKAELDAAVSPLAVEATLTAIKGVGWSTETLAAIKAVLDTAAADVANIDGAAMRGTDGAELAGAAAAAVVGLSTFDPSTTEVDVGAVKGVAVTSVADFKADVSGLAATGEAATAVATLNDFDPATDVVAHVTLVDTVTTNTDMRGTDGAELSGAAATAVATLNDFDPATDVVARVTLVDTVTTNTDMRGTDGAELSGAAATAVGTLNDFDPATESVNVGAVNGTPVTSVNDFKADVSGLALTGEAATAVGTLSIPTAADNADAVWDEDLSGHTAAGSAGDALSDAGSAGDPWNTALPGAYGAGTAGSILSTVNTTTDKLDDTLEDDAGTYRFTENALEQAPSGTGSTPQQIWEYATRTITGGAYNGTPPSATDIATAVWANGTRTLSSFGTLVADTAAAVWAAVTRTITGGTVTTNNDKTGYSLAADQAVNVTKVAGSAVTGVNDFKTDVTGLATSAEITALNDLSAAQVQSAVTTSLNTYDPPTKAELDAAVSPLSTTANVSAVSTKVDTIDGIVDAIKLKTDNLPASPAAVGSAMTLAANAVSASVVSADAVTEIQSGLATSAEVSALETKVDTVDTVADAIKAKTDNLPASPAATGAAMTLTVGERTAISAALLASTVTFPDGNTMTLEETIEEIWAGTVGDYDLTGVNWTIKWNDGTAAFVFEIDDADAPTSRTRI